MRLSLEDVEVFFRLHRSLMCFVNRRLEVVEGKIATPENYAKLPGDVRYKVHQALIDHQELIDAFADENPYHFDEAELEIVRSWKHLVFGTFYAFRQLKTHMIFLSTTEPVVAYGVLALFDPFEDMIGTDLPRMVKTTLLPFKGRIVYDGLMMGQNIHFGGGIRRSLAEGYNEAKEREGIITSLPAPAWGSLPVRREVFAGKKASKPKRGGPKISTSANPASEKIVALIDAFCREHLDEEYAVLCRKMAGVLSRKRPSPLARGKPESWASGIVRTVGWVNFLGDPSQPHHMKMSEIDEGFGVSEATGSAKSKAIRDLLGIHPFDHEWTLPGRMEQNPMIWMVQVNGLIVDVRHLPREIQEEAFRKGLIPYIPDDRAGEG